MTVDDLRKMIEGVDGKLEVIVRAWDDDGTDYCSSLDTEIGGEVQHAHDENDTPYFAIDCCPGDGEPTTAQERANEKWRRGS